GQVLRLRLVLAGLQVARLEGPVLVVGGACLVGRDVVLVGTLAAHELLRAQECDGDSYLKIRAANMAIAVRGIAGTSRARGRELRRCGAALPYRAARFPVPVSS